MTHDNIPGYVIDRLIGQGGMGRVFSGFRTKDNLPVCVKVVLPSLCGEKARQLFQRFEREFDTASRLKHPNIVKLIEFGISPSSGHPYLVMELLKGQTLDEYVQIEPLSEQEALRIAKQICSAFSYYHPMGVVHRDIKPSNIFIEDSGRAVLLDFGLAYASARTRLTRTGEIVGTLAALAPEQLRNDPIDGRTDIFQLGASLFKALEGFWPYTPQELALITFGGASQDSFIPVFQRNDLGEHVRRLVLTCLQAAPDKRFPDAPSLYSAIEDSMSRPPDTIARGPRFEPGKKTGSRANRVAGTIKAPTARDYGETETSDIHDSTEEGTGSNDPATPVPAKGRAGLEQSTGKSALSRYSALGLILLVCTLCAGYFFTRRHPPYDMSGELQGKITSLRLSVLSSGAVPSQKDCDRMGHLLLGLRKYTPTASASTPDENILHGQRLRGALYYAHHLLGVHRKNNAKIAWNLLTRTVDRHAGKEIIACLETAAKRLGYRNELIKVFEGLVIEPAEDFQDYLRYRLAKILYDGFLAKARGHSFVSRELKGYMEIAYNPDKDVLRAAKLIKPVFYQAASNIPLHKRAALYSDILHAVRTNASRDECKLALTSLLSETDRDDESFVPAFTRFVSLLVIRTRDHKEGDLLEASHTAVPLIRDVIDHFTSRSMRSLFKTWLGLAYLRGKQAGKAGRIVTTISPEMLPPGRKWRYYWLACLYYEETGDKSTAGSLSKKGLSIARGKAIQYFFRRKSFEVHMEDILFNTPGLK